MSRVRVPAMIPALKQAAEPTTSAPANSRTRVRIGSPLVRCKRSIQPATARIIAPRTTFATLCSIVAP